MAIETFQRQEIKFLLNEVQYQALTEQLEQYMNPTHTVWAARITASIISITTRQTII